MKKIGILAIFSLGLLIGWLASQTEWLNRNQMIAVRQGTYEFINPLLECELDGQGVGFKELKSFKNRVIDKVRAFKNNGRSSHVSVYFRDLNNGPWFGIYEKEEFSPGSLLKIPMMMAAFRQEELTENFLRKNVLRRFRQ